MNLGQKALTYSSNSFDSGALSRISTAAYV